MKQLVTIFGLIVIACSANAELIEGTAKVENDASKTSLGKQFVSVEGAAGMALFNMLEGKPEAYDAGSGITAYKKTGNKIDCFTSGGRTASCLIVVDSSGVK